MEVSDMQSLSLFDPQLDLITGQPTLFDVVRKACADKNFPVLRYILQTINYVPLEPVDGNGNTILHFIISNLDDMGGIPFLQSFLTNKHIKNIINIQSKGDGFTPAILACAMKLHKVIDMLKEAGADINIPSHDGTAIVTATETETRQEPRTVIRQVERPEKAQGVQQGISSSMRNALQKFLAPITRHSEIPESSLGMSTVEPRGASFNQVQTSRPISNELSTEAFIKGVMNNSLGTTPSFSQPEMRTGGSRSVAVGQRFLNKAPEYSSVSGGKPKKSKGRSSKMSRQTTERSSEARGSVELGRITDDIHERTVETIKSLLGVDEETARAYKSILYFRVKEKHPEFSGYERAVEMEKIATKSELKTISEGDVKDAKNRRAELKSASASSTSPDAEKKPRRKKSNSDMLSADASEKKSTRKPKKEWSSSESTSSLDLDTDL
jgi:hypothetical protein